MCCQSCHHQRHHTPTDPDCVIVYCTTRCQSEKLTAVLKTKFGLNAAFYHGNMSDKEKSEKMQKFKSSDIDIMCCTTAFGMGIDKRNVRAVIHFTMSYNLTNYYQESSRAGRDGKPAYCILFYHPRDIAHVRNVLLRGKSRDQMETTLTRLRTMTSYCCEAQRCRHLVIKQCILHVPVGKESCFANTDQDLSPPAHTKTCCDNCVSQQNGSDLQLILPMSDIQKYFDDPGFFSVKRAVECVHRLLRRNWNQISATTVEIDEYTKQQVLLALTDREIIVRSSGSRQKKPTFSRGQ